MTMAAKASALSIFSTIWVLCLSGVKGWVIPVGCTIGKGAHLSRVGPLGYGYPYHRPGYINYNNGYHDNMYDNYGRYDHYYQGLYGQRLARITGYEGGSREGELRCISALEREGFQVVAPDTASYEVTTYRWNASREQLELDGTDTKSPKYIPVYRDEYNQGDYYGSDRGYLSGRYSHYYDRPFGANRGDSYGNGDRRYY